MARVNTATAADKNMVVWKLQVLACTGSQVLRVVRYPAEIPEWSADGGGDNGTGTAVVADHKQATAADTGSKKKGQVQQAAVPASACTATVAAVPKTAPSTKPSFLSAAKKAIAPNPEETAVDVEAAIAAHAEATAQAAVKAGEENEAA